MSRLRASDQVNEMADRVTTVSTIRCEECPQTDDDDVRESLDAAACFYNRGWRAFRVRDRLSAMTLCPGCAAKRVAPRKEAAGGH